MATFSRRTVTTVRHEFTVPSGPYGAPAAEISKAWAVADREYRAAFNLTEAAALPDDAIVFRPGDDEVVLSFETRTEA